MPHANAKAQAGPAGAPPPASVETRVRAEAQPLAESLCAASGLELVHFEYLRQQSGRTMRIYIDKPGGVTLEDCAAVSRELGDLLDVHLPDIGPYHLEVSSPGANRPLSREADYRRFSGRRAKIRLRSALNGQRNFSGILDGVQEGSVRLKMETATVDLPLEAIARAHLTDAQVP